MRRILPQRALARVSTFAGLVMAGAGLLAACAHSQSRGPSAANNDTVTVSLREIFCQSCGAASVKALEKRADVASASFDRDKAELTILYDKLKTRPEVLLEVVHNLGYEAELGAGRGSYSAEFEFPPDLNVRWISKDGTNVDIRDHLAPGKVTVFDFYATWCGPCREVDREMLSVLRENSDVALCKLDVFDWESAVARRYLTNVSSLPYVIVYSMSGTAVDVIPGLDLERLRRAIDKGRTM